MVGTFDFNAVGDLSAFLHAVADSLVEIGPVAEIGQLTVKRVTLDEFTVQEMALRLSIVGAIKLENVSFTAAGKRIIFPHLSLSKAQLEFKVLPEVVDDAVVIFKEEGDA